LKIPEDQPIIDKLKKHFKASTVDFRESEAFKQFLEKFSKRLCSEKNCCYMIIKEIIFELKKYSNEKSAEKILRLEKLLGVRVGYLYFFL